ncbi:MAG: cold shock protein [Thermomicrobiales bacterium]|jgi:CspA family cold shock protein|nr:cold shock protein [Thermomicrobiales bacterium]MEA2530104.1 cold shock protein [Thermomicrobiales bacterium]MEA2586155.1 cold shock protein [Thermomicrobiales bacterium]MEA2598198.1 cold shock protein [Thermomicrobiales bacterium]
MATGIIKSIRDKGFGFIARDGDSGNGDLFFHSSAVHDQGFDGLQQGQRVGFDEEPDPRDPSRRRAVNVRPSDTASE